MDGRAFFDQVDAHGGLNWLGSRQGAGPGTDEVYVGHALTGARYALPVEAILAHEWDELEAVLTGKRRPRVLTHLTRIVGYFSQVHNWNRSKHAELRDRRLGAYTVDEPASAGDDRVLAAAEGRAQAVA
jgi:hypothetical protein